MTENSFSKFKISHYDWRRTAKKLRRKRIRQTAARIREDELKRKESSPTFLNNLIKIKLLDEFETENEDKLRDKLHRQWLDREEESQRRWQEQEAIKNKQENDRRAIQEKIRAEWESARKKKEEQKKLLLAQQEEAKSRIDLFLKEGGKVPEELKLLTETNPGREQCPFFSKVAACRFGPTCSRNHIIPAVSSIILLPNFYTHFSMSSNRGNEYDTDVSLEFDENDTYKDFSEFFSDVVSELENFGQLQTVQVCRNFESHLRGNLYAQYSTEREALLAARGLNARWYGGRQLTVYFANLRDWGAAICGDFKKGRCPKGSECNFLHVFRNPRGLFTPRFVKPSVPQHSARSWRWSESPERSHRSRSGSRSDVYRRRRRSRDRRSRSREKSNRTSSRDRSTSSRSSKRKSRRSRSRDRKKSSGVEKKRAKKRRTSDESSTTRASCEKSFSEREVEEEITKRPERRYDEHTTRNRS